MNSTQVMLDILNDLDFGDHLCLIYRSRQEQFSVVAPFIRQGLEKKEKCLYIADDRTVQEVKDVLAQEGIDVQAYLDSGQLHLLVKEQAYVKDGYFDPDKMITLLAESTEVALQEGFQGLRATGEMTWIIARLPGSERLIEYEAKLNHFFHGSKALAICQYNETRFSPELLLNVLATHPIVIVAGLVTHNFYYIPPDEFLLEKQNPAKEYARYLSHIQEREQLALNLKQRAKELEQKVRELDEAWNRADILLDLMGHDLTNINQGIMLALELILQAPNLSKKMKNQLEMAIGQVERSAELIKNVKRFHHIVTEPRRLGNRSLFLALTAAADAIDKAFPHKVLHLKTTLREGEYYVIANGMLVEVFYNLFHNAMKFDPKEQVTIEVTVGPAPEEKFLQIEVKDRGPGVPDEEKNKILTRFIGEKPRFDGSGVGLAVVHQLVDGYGGRIRVEDRIKGDHTKGANFIVILQQGREK